MDKKWYEVYFGEGSIMIATDCCVIRDKAGRLFVAGSPITEEDGLNEELCHSCDAQGCASVGPHIIGEIK